MAAARQNYQLATIAEDSVPVFLLNIGNDFHRPAVEHLDLGNNENFSQFLIPRRHDYWTNCLQEKEDIHHNDKIRIIDCPLTSAAFCVLDLKTGTNLN